MHQLHKIQKSRTGLTKQQFRNGKRQYQQNTWPQGVAVGCSRLPRQRVHLVAPLAWVDRESLNYAVFREK